MTNEYQRKLASVQQIAEVKPIKDADRIVAYRVNGWWIVDQKDKYQVNDLVVYCEIDSWLPNSIAPFLSKGKEPRVYKGIAGERLRTIKLKKQISQGLILSLDVLSNVESELFEGLDVTFPLGIIKWEPEPEFRHADAKGTFPSFIPKTDQERIQNCYQEVFSIINNEVFLVEEKLEGQSSTVYFKDGEFGVCSRNLELKDSDNTFWNTANKYNLKEKLTKLKLNIAIQSEQVGPGISGNIYKLSEYLLYVFDVYDIDKQQYFTRFELENLCQKLELVPVPLLFTHKGELTLQEMLNMADGKTTIGKTTSLREGLVWRKQSGNRLTFKVISNDYLLSTP